MKSGKMRFAMRTVALFVLLGAGLGQLLAQPLPKDKAGNGIREDDDKPVMYKCVNAEGNMLTLESYVTGQTITIEKTLPVDICLVLDLSGSMGTYLGYTTTYKIEVLDDAVQAFVDVVKQQAIENPIDGQPANHRISIVKFADPEYYDNSTYHLAEGNHTYWRDPAYAEVVKNFRNVYNCADELKSVATWDEDDCYNGTTAVEYGMQLAINLFSSNNPYNTIPYTDPTVERSKVAVMFTDGTPTHGDEFDVTVANAAIDKALQLKQAGYKVYTVGVFENEDLNNPNVQTYMDAVSSNYPNATSMTNLGTKTESNYFYTTQDAQGLINIFETIAEEAAVVKCNMNSSTVVQDVISEYFELPAGTTTSDIHVYTANCTGIDGSGELVFGGREPMANPNITINGKVIRVSNFDFGTNWCGPHSAGGTNYSGKKLIIDIPIVANPNYSPGTHPTNGPGSTIFPDGEEETPFEDFQTPKYYVKGKTWVEAVTSAPAGWSLDNIDSAEDLAWLISYVCGYNGSDAHPGAVAKLTADVDMSAYLWVPIGGWGYCLNKQAGGNMDYSYPQAHGFSGTFDGQGHVIRGLNNIDPVSMPQGGMFGNVNGGTVKNTFVIGCQVIGAVGTDENSAATQLCTGTEGHFGIIADTLSNHGTIFNCETEGVIMTYDTINNMYKETPIAPLYENPEKAYIGGLVGLVTGESTVHSCISVASLLGYNMGGCAYEVEEGSGVQNCYNYALFRSWFPTIGSNLGGLVAVNNGDVQNCYLRNRADETKTVHENLPEINFTGIYGAVEAAGKNNVRGTWHKGLLIGQNNNTAQYVYIPKAWKDCNAIDTDNNAVCFVGFESSNAAQNVGWFTDAVTPYLYKHNDTKVTNLLGTNNYIEDAPNDRLLQTLNNWANANGCTPWMRTTADGINNDYPVLKIAGLQSVASDDAIVLFYGNVNDMMSSRSLMTTPKQGDTICLYENAALTSGNNGTTLYINEDVAVTQTDGLVNTAYVGITLDNSAGKNGVNSDHGFADDEIDWHMFATSLSNAPLGINYTDNEEHPFSYEPGVNLECYFYSEGTQDGYFPSLSFGTDGTDGIHYYRDWDFYCWSEAYQHYINFKRNSNSHWTEGVNSENEHVKIPYENEGILYPGKGYMLAIANETFLQSHGTLNNGLVENEQITYTANPFCVGYNLIGNPYQSYLDFDKFVDVNYENTGIDTYVIIDEDNGGYLSYTHSMTTRDDMKYINMHQGFFVKVNEGASTVKFTNAMRSCSNEINAHFRGEGKTTYPFLKLTVTEANGIRDYATVEFNRPELGGGEKFMDLRAGNAQIYVHNGGTNYSTLFATSDIDEVPVRFNTLEDGTFTLSWQFSAGDFIEMYLIDNIAGQKIDMLTHNEYKFEGHAKDYASRFNVVFAIDGDSNSESDAEPVESFAFQMDGNLIVNGMGTCQVFDLTGRLVVTAELTDTQNTMALPQSAGIYMIRLVNGSSVKVQKIVVR